MEKKHSYESLNDLRVALHRNGYLPVPITAPSNRDPQAGKKPVMDKWQTVCAETDEEMVRRWSHEWPSCTNTGILTNRCRAVDIDVHDADLAQRLLALAFEHFGPSPLLRTGQKPKILGVWAGIDEFPKASTKPFLLPNGTSARVEILAVGQQFVAYGDHPVTYLPYYWHGDTPLDVPVCELEVIGFDAAKTFCAAAEEMIIQAGGVPVKKPKKIKAIKSRFGTTSASKSDNVVPLLSSDAESWATAALHAEYDNVAHAMELTRNDTLNIAAFNLGQIVGAGHLSEGQVINFLAEAAQVVGLEDKEILPTIRSGLTAGMKNPRSPKPREPYQRRKTASVKTAGTGENVHAVDREPEQTPYDLFGDPELTGIPVMPYECVPDAIEGFARDEAERLGVDPAMIAVGCVVACAAVTDDKWKIQPKRLDTRWTESARLWLGTIASPSAKKTPSLNAVIAPLLKIDWEYAELDEPIHEEFEVENKIHLKRMEIYTAAQAKGEDVQKPVPPTTGQYIIGTQLYGRDPAAIMAGGSGAASRPGRV